MCENRVLRISGPKREEVTGGRRNNELYNLHSSSNIIMIIKSRRMSWTGYVAGMKDQKFIQNTGQKT
jgi:hypothetical protein